MWRKQQQEEDEERKRHDFDDYYNCESSKTKRGFQFDELCNLSWEEQAFAEDGLLGGCVWPPTSYSCSFCGRQLRSAQALGGHMNVHRRDRARLKQSPNTINSSPHDPHLSTLPNYDDLHHNPKTLSADRSPGAVFCGGRSDLKAETDEKLVISCPRVREKDRVGIHGILDEGLNFGFGRPRPMSGFFDDGREEGGYKRRKMDDESEIQFYVKSSSLVDEHHHHLHLHRIQSEVIGISSSSLNDLDLELRLGGLSKG